MGDVFLTQLVPTKCPGEFHGVNAQLVPTKCLGEFFTEFYMTCPYNVYGIY